MAELDQTKPVRRRKIRYKGRGSQVLIYLGKQLRFFINESDWKVLPMAAIIAGLVGMVLRNRLFVSMEGTLIGAFALTCTAIWNGCFNSIQAVCRERAIIKREHRSGMHVSSYVAAHMIYQLLLCVAQTIVCMYVLIVLNIEFPAQGFMTPWMVVDVGISMLLITYASDMMSLFISSISHTTTGAMTVMPFVLIFQLVFAGTIIPLPEWSKGLAQFTISNYGIHAIAAQSGYNELPMNTAWDLLAGMRDSEVGGDVTAGQIMDFLQTDKISQLLSEETLGETLTLKDVTDSLIASEQAQAIRGETFTVKLTVQDLFDMFGEENMKTFIRQKTAEASRKAEFDRTVENIVDNWLMLGFFIFVFALLAMMSLELIDKDKR